MTQLLEGAQSAMKTVYSDVTQEYRALRSACGLLVHEGAALLEVTGGGAVGYLGAVTTRPVDFLLEGQSAAALVLRPDGTLVAEVVVHARTEGYLVQVWPAQADGAREHLLAAAGEHPDATVVDRSDELTVLALEGPTSFGIAGRYLELPISSLGYRAHATATWNGVSLLVSRTGLTGEYGYTFIVPAEHADALAAEFTDAGAVTCGLDALDICRMETRFVNIEREGTPDATPFDLGLQWMVDFSGEFTGRERVLERWTPAESRVLVCWTTDDDTDAADATPPQGGLAVSVGGEVVGEVAHAVHSPQLGRVIGTARVDAAVAASGLELVVGDRAVRTVSAPFLVATSFGVTID